MAYRSGEHEPTTVGIAFRHRTRYSYDRSDPLGPPLSDASLPLE